MATVDASISEAASASDESATLHALAPIADADAGDYTNSAGGSLYAAIDEVVANASDFIKSGDEPVSDPVKFQHAVASTNDAPRVIAYEARASGGGQVNVTIELWCDQTWIATFTDNNVGSTAKYFHQLTAAQRAAITDRTKLYTKVITTKVGSTISASITEGANASDSVSVPNDQPTGNWTQRSTARGVVRAMQLSDPDDLGTNSWQSYVGYEPGTYSQPTIDEGAGYMRFNRPSQAGSDPTGYWHMNFSDDGSVLFDAGDTFYAQVQTWYSQGWFDQIYLQTNGDPQFGIKLFDVAAGHQGGVYYNTSPGLKIVIQTYNEIRAPNPYGYNYAHSDQNMYVYGTNVLENSFPACIGEGDGSLRPQMMPAECFCLVPETWQVWKIGVDILSRVTVSGHSCFHFRLRLWGAVLGQPSVLLHDWGPDTSGYFPLLASDSDTLAPLSFGQIVLFPYLTGQSATQVCSPAEARYREVIISTEDIADPTFDPAWRQGRTVGEWAAITGTSAQSSGIFEIRGGEGEPIKVWSGFAWTPAGRCIMALQGGHGDSSDNGAYGVDFAADAPTWSVLCARSSSANTPSKNDNGGTGYAYYPLDGRPASRHVYYHAAYIGRRNMVFFPCQTARWSNAGTSGFESDAFHLDTNSFDSAGAWQNGPLSNPSTALAQDPSTDDLYIYRTNSGNGWYKWTQADAGPTTGWSQIFPTAAPDAQNKPMIVDGGNIIIITGDGALYKLSTSTMVTSSIALSGDAISSTRALYAGLVHDLDNDRYVMVCYDGTVFAITPSGVVTTLDSTLTAPDYPGENKGVYTRVAYIPSLGGIIYCPTYTDDFQFLPTR